MSNCNQSLLKSLAFGGYRSFGDIQRFTKFSKVNLFIGQNNCGKSNVLRFIHEVYSKLGNPGDFQQDPLDRHLPNGGAIYVGVSRDLSLDEKTSYKCFNDEILPLFPENIRRTHIPGVLLSAFQRKAEDDRTYDAWFDYKIGSNGLSLAQDSWIKAFEGINSNQLQEIWYHLTRRTGGSRDAHWAPETINIVAAKPSQATTSFIPAIRKIGGHGSISDDFSGEGIIERLVKLQNPSVHNQSDRAKFQSINRFLQTVTDNETAKIEIPHDRETILVHMDEKTLPLESLGTGIHEVIILASAATILENTIVCMEEPELHLNPLLQKKLVRYLSSATNNQYFITTHSAALMDTPEAEIYHIRLINGSSISERATSDKHRSLVCEDLGYHPSDLLQANCIIWVEGPSDRIYINYWIKHKAPELIEGVNYSIMYYGGRLASHLSGNDHDEIVDDFISLRRLNRRGAIIIDSDKKSANSRINTTKIRLDEEFNKGAGFSWITAGREIENYIPAQLTRDAIKNVIPSARANSSFEKYENCLSIITKSKKSTQASKVDIARYITTQYEPDYSRMDLGKKIDLLIRFIADSNI